MAEDTPFQEFPAYVQRRSSSKPKILFVIASLLILAAVILAGLYFIGASNKEASTKTPVPTARPTAEPTIEPTSSPSASVTLGPTKKVTPTPTPKSTKSADKLDRSNLKVTVLNGSGVTGAAKGESTYLSGLGYTIVSTGNADKEDYKGFVIKIKKSKSEYLPQLKKDVAANASASSSVTASIDDSISTDAEVIVGK